MFRVHHSKFGILFKEHYEHYCSIHPQLNNIHSLGACTAEEAKDMHSITIETGFSFSNVKHDIIIYSISRLPTAASCNETILSNIMSFKYAFKSLNFKLLNEQRQLHVIHRYIPKCIVYIFRTFPKTLCPLYPSFSVVFFFFASSAKMSCRSKSIIINCFGFNCTYRFECLLCCSKAFLHSGVQSFNTIDGLSLFNNNKRIIG